MRGLSPTAAAEDGSAWLDAWLDAVRPAQPEALAVASFKLVHALTPDAGGAEKAAIWGALAQRIHRRFPHWNASGPHAVADGALAFWGGIPRGDTVVFRLDGAVFFTRRRLRPGPTWQPEYAALQPLEAYLAAHPDPPRRTE